MILHIDSKDQRIIKVSLKKGGKMMECLTKENVYGSQVLLSLIDEILKKNKLDFKDIKGIEVETGPGSFTGLRVGVSVANALGFTLGSSVNGKKIETKLVY